MRLTTLFSILLLSACRPSGSAPLEPARCGPGVPEAAQHPIAMRPAELAGDYTLVQVQTQPVTGTATSGRLHLSPPDSAAKAGAVGGAVRDLIGWLDPNRGDEARPDAVLAGEHLRIGRLQHLDGWATNLTITAVSKDGFWGWWQAERGLWLQTEPGTRRVVPDPAGYFCALRNNE